MSKLIEKVTEHLIENFKGMTRWNKAVPYHTHPIAVRDIALTLLDEYLINYASWSESERRRYNLIVQIVALQHDTIEDVKKYLNNSEKLIVDLKLLDIDKELLETDWLAIKWELDNLNKNNHDDYLQFILKAHSYVISRIVKIADIKHNLSDSKDGCLKDKYLLALYILEKL